MPFFSSFFDLPEPFRRVTDTMEDIFSNSKSARKPVRHRSRANVPQRAAPQTYEDIKAECVSAGALWEDPHFGAEAASLFYDQAPSLWPDIDWRRPHEICEEPQFIVGDASRLDVKQGVVGDCWMLAALAALCNKKVLLDRVVPADQTFTDDYGGIFRFQFWQYGRWVEVCVDDRLPCYDGKLIYMHSGEGNEFWSALLEKAYAKLYGSYEHLSGGLTSEAFTDFTAGVTERLQLQDKTPEGLFLRMSKAHRVGALMGCWIVAAPSEMESSLDNGLIIGHAYSITDVRTVDVEGGMPMVRIRNPWGDSHEWLGAWGDKSDEWAGIDEDTKADLGLTFDHDGEFWMSFDDYVANYQWMEICYLCPDSFPPEAEGVEADVARRWSSSTMAGSWKRFSNAGGARNFNPRTFWTNPQFRVAIPEPDDDDEDGLATVIVAVMQKGRREMRNKGHDCQAIGYEVFQLEDDRTGALDRNFFSMTEPVAKSPSFMATRDLASQHNLAPGNYVVVPCTFEPNKEADFLLRLLTTKEDDVLELDEDEIEVEESALEHTEDDEAQTESAREAFRAAVGEDGEVDAYELRDILNQIFTQDIDFEGFSSDVCRGMVAMRDLDLSGKLCFSDFEGLWDELQLCKKVFKEMDEDGSGHFSSFEFKIVLRKLAYLIKDLQGMRVDRDTFNAIVLRYSDKEGHVHFDDFVSCVVKLKTLFATFQGKLEDDGGENEATFARDEFIQLSMYS